ncbi:ABC transporter permease [Gelidibacter gilvus]|uniref:FtsX-like permease family protein n=1 Tax=Gelidibacter gilvus TaxID=59602 RepID=A0A4Q0XHQ3_9FLAO|nr:ABC transporter permease [Gelidibacter gilvus]RXJ50501.1 FtsX-like permease family protein [Gelidibacter gilvus]
MLLYLRLFKESFSFAINALTNNKLRTFLSLLGVTIGIFSIIAVLAAVDSLDRNIQDQLSGLDKNTMYLTKFSFLTTDVPRWQRDNFPQTDSNDFDFIRRNVPDIAASAYLIFGSPQTVKYESETISGVNISPASNGIYDIDNIKIEEGRFYTEPESINGAPVIVLGYSVAENLFGNVNPLGKQIRAYGRKLTVIGVIKKMGGLAGNSDDSAYVPANFVRRFQSGGINGIPGAIMIKPEKGIDIGAFEGVLKQKFRAYRGLKAGDPDNFFVNKMSGQTDQIDAIIGSMNLMGWIISGFSLLVGGFGIANIMFVSVKERTNLIGIQKSLGAKNRFILFQFLFEAVILAVIGGLIGLFFVWVVSLIASQFTGDFEFVLSAGNMFLGFMLSSIIGLVSGVIPAISASKLDPVEAIRTGM